MTAVAATLFRRVRAWYAGFAILLAVVVAVIAALVAASGSLTTSAWLLGSASTVKWFVGPTAIMLIPVYLRQYVSLGVTRRQFLGGGLLFSLGSAGVAALYTMAGFGVERLVFGAAGLMDGLTEPYPVHSAGSAAAVLVRAFLIYLAHICSGWLLGAAFYRFGPFGGLVLIPPAVLPALGSEVFFGSEWSVVHPVTVAGVELSFAASALLTVALVLAGAVVVHAFGRSVAIRGKIT
ncbi:hypothetical protein ACIA8K_34910 [Catenuloplanes sp. NPDC051500]|uniref:hypothetical protein n=1 Tax=Catenuloplanes sp. NPDC051500 TaxID=3363959 RepID=UPI0037B222D8